MQKPQSEKGKTLAEMIDIYMQLSSESKTGSADYAEGVRDALQAVRFARKLTA